MNRQVVVLNQYALPRTEGGGTRHIDLFGRLLGWDPLIIAGNRNHYTQSRFQTPDPRFRLVAVPVQRGGSVRRLLGWLAFALQAGVLTLSRRRLDVVYASSPQPFGALAGLLAARLRGAAFVLEVRDLWPESIVAAGRLRRGSRIHGIFTLVEKALARNALRIVCVTQGWEDHFASLGISTDRLVVVPNGTEPADFAVSEETPELRRRHQIEGFTAVFAGAHGEKDGLDYILDAAAVLPAVRFLLVGSGPAKADAQARALREQLGNVQFRDPVSKQELPGLLRACDVGVHAVTPLAVFQQGMSPNKLFDYMAAGLPVVSNAAGPLNRILADGECGRLGGPDDLASCLRAVREASSAQRNEWSRRSSEIIRTRYSRERAAATLSEVLGRSVDQQTRPLVTFAAPRNSGTSRCRHRNSASKGER